MKKSANTSQGLERSFDLYRLFLAVLIMLVINLTFIGYQIWQTQSDVEVMTIKLETKQLDVRNRVAALANIEKLYRDEIRGEIQLIKGALGINLEVAEGDTEEETN